MKRVARRRGGGAEPAGVFRFLLMLRGVKPLVWRRVQVPARYSFWDLHVAIQDAMGWADSHLHRFEMTRAARPANRA